ncbi:MAG: nucleoside triphosphate pyrophosphohydrolase [Syntrophales bacterium]|jgi:tetrapyrrole methylase family protein/MazG family protein|nr:nucleoside triphosphate pyrophosphohydrolase [Syntrophales bacterium]
MTQKIPRLRNEIEDLLQIIRTLRGPNGCLWDREQTPSDIGRYLLEEAYEVVDAIEESDAEHLKEELGDLLFQILFLCAFAEERDEYRFSDIVSSVSAKMIRRHPHVFGNVSVRSIEEIKNNWSYIKEHVENKPVQPARHLGKYPMSMPALSKAQKLTEQAAGVGFDWENTRGVLDKIVEEIDELKDAIHHGRVRQIEIEIGDLFFSIVNLCRFVDIDAEQSLKKTINKFEQRFAYIEDSLKNQQKTLMEASSEEMNHLWDEAKAKEGDRK